MEASPSEAAFKVQLFPAYLPPLPNGPMLSQVLALVSCPSRLRLPEWWEQVHSLSGQGPLSGGIIHPLGHGHASPALLELGRHFTF